MGRFAWFQKSYKRKKMSWDASKSSSKSIMGKRMSAKRKTVIDDAEIIGRESIYEASLARRQLWIRCSTSVIEYTKKQQTTLGECEWKSRSQMRTSHPTFRFESSQQRKMKFRNKLTMKTIL